MKSKVSHRLAFVSLLLTTCWLPTAMAKAQTGPTTLSQKGSFYVGGRDIEQNGSTTRVESMYVEYMVPKRRLKKTPIILVHGNYQNGTAFQFTPDGRPGWAETLLKHGYAVYIVDQPMRGRSPYNPKTDGPAATMSAAQIERLFTAPELTSPIPQARKHSQWPGTGRAGDPVFDQLYASQQPTVAGPNDRIDAVLRKAVKALLDRIGPAVILTHSRAGTLGWEAADDAPELVKAIVAIEPNGPPFFDPPAADGKPADKMARPWGVTYDHMTFDPPVSAPTDLAIAQESQAQGPDLLRCWLQSGTPRRLAHLAKTPVMIVSGEASYHAPYDHCTARFLEQAGVPTSFVRLENEGIKGNGHLMMLEKNSDQIIALIERWIARQVP